MAETCPNNISGLTQYDGQCNFFGDDTPLDEWVGWVVVCAFGFGFSILTSVIVWIDYTYGGTKFSSEEFNTAGRSVKTGLTAAVIVSQWTWAATLLQSSNVAYQYGISGPFWYASGATIQVLLFAILAIQVKLRAPRAHTLLEIVRARWGKPAHLVFMFFAFSTNTLVSAMLILGGAAVTSALTGINIYAASMLIPVGVILYTAAGGLKATFLASYIHTTILYLALLIFSFKIYASSEHAIGSPGAVWERLRDWAVVNPVADNRGGSLLTMFSEGGLIFGVINIVGNFGTVFLDQSYWQSAIAAKPSATYKGYILGGLCWFALPFTLATSLGLASRALDLPITPDEAGAGLVPPAVAVHIMGSGGAGLILVMLFMAVTSTGSAEQIAVSSLYAYDVYRTYINPKATGKQIVDQSRIAIVAYGIFMGVIAIILNEIGLNLGWVYLFMGIIVGPAVFPIYCMLTWNKVSAVAAISGAISGMVGAITAWLVTCAAEFDGNITVDNLGTNFPMLAGNVTALGLSCIVTTVLSFIFPQNFDWEKMRTGIEMIEIDGTDLLKTSGADSEPELKKALRRTTIWGSTLSIVLVLVWPLLTLPATVFSRGYFTFWTVLSIVWGLVAAIAMVFLPIIESAPAILTALKNIATGNKTSKASTLDTSGITELEASKHESTVHKTDNVKPAAAGAYPAVAVDATPAEPVEPPAEV